MATCKWRTRERTKKRALLIGIEYAGADKLKGTIRDIKRFSWVLRTYYKFENEELLVLTDSDNTGINHVEHGVATRKSIMESLDLFTSNLQSGDSLILFFAGHGGQKVSLLTRNDSNPEADGLDEYIYPSDFRTTGYILDDDLYKRVVKRIPRGASLRAIADCCHAGTLLDLPYIYDPDNRGDGIRGSNGNLAKDVSASFSTFNRRLKKQDGRGAARALAGAFARTVIGAMSGPGSEEPEKIDGLIMLLSAGKDDERALAKTEDNFFCGALTDALIKILLASEDKTVTIGHVISKLRDDLASKDQTPQISCSKVFDTSEIFLSPECEENPDHNPYLF